MQDNRFPSLKINDPLLAQLECYDAPTMHPSFHPFSCSGSAYCSRVSHSIPKLTEYNQKVGCHYLIISRQISAPPTQSYQPEKTLPHDNHLAKLPTNILDKEASADACSDESLGIDEEEDTVSFFMRENRPQLKAVTKASVNLPSRQQQHYGRVEYSIVLSPTYQVPVLYFTLHNLPPTLSPSSIDTVYDLLVPESFRPSIKQVGVMGVISMGVSIVHSDYQLSETTEFTESPHHGFSFILRPPLQHSRGDGGASPRTDSQCAGISGYLAGLGGQLRRLASSQGLRSSLRISKIIVRSILKLRSLFQSKLNPRKSHFKRLRYAQCNDFPTLPVHPLRV